MLKQEIIDSLIILVFRDTPFFYIRQGIIGFFVHIVNFIGELAHTLYKFSLNWHSIFFFWSPYCKIPNQAP